MVCHPYQFFFVEDVRIVISPESTSVDEGNTVILTCVGYGVPYAAISWEREGVGLTNDSRITIYEEPLTEGGVTFTKSVLEICSAQVFDTGSYSCIADNGVSNDTVLFDVTVLPVGGKIHMYKIVHDLLDKYAKKLCRRNQMGNLAAPFLL